MLLRILDRENLFLPLVLFLKYCRSKVRSVKPTPLVEKCHSFAFAMVFQSLTPAAEKMYNIIFQ